MLASLEFLLRGSQFVAKPGQCFPVIAEIAFANGSFLDVCQRLGVNRCAVVARCGSCAGLHCCSLDGSCARRRAVAERDLIQLLGSVRKRGPDAILIAC